MVSKRNKHVLEDLLTPDELCCMLKVKKQRVYDWVHLDRIPYIKVGRFLRFSRPDIEDWLKANSSGIINSDARYE